MPLLPLRMCLSKFRASYQEMCSSAAHDVRLYKQALTRMQQVCWALARGFLEKLPIREDKCKRADESRLKTLNFLLTLKKPIPFDTLLQSVQNRHGHALCICCCAVQKFLTVSTDNSF